jgi:hypothetical protein
MTHSVHIFSNKNRKESYEEDSLNMSLNLVRFKKFFLLCSRVGAGAGAAGSGAASKFLPGAGSGAV